MKRTLIFIMGLVTCGVLISGLTWAQEVAWMRTFGEPNSSYSANSVQQTSDGGYILAGSAKKPHGSQNVLLIKTDAQGQKEWEKTFGGARRDWAKSVQQTSDGGYIVVAVTYSFGMNGGMDAWLIKTDAQGQKEWDRTFYTVRKEWNNYNRARSVQQTSDGGYIIAGVTCNDAASDGVNHFDDGWLIKTDAQGQKEWEKTFGNKAWGGRESSDGFNSVQQTSDGGYILAGEKDNFNLWLLKTNSKGEKEWDKIFTGSPYSVQQTSDGGYIVAGVIESARDNAWLIKTDVKGQKEWDKTFKWEEGYKNDQARSVQQTSDGGYVLVGMNWSPSAEGERAWLIKTDVKGQKEWGIIFEGLGHDLARSVQQTSDGGYIVAGYLMSSYETEANAWLIKVRGESTTGVEDREKEFGIPEEFTLSQNYPNPFNPTTEIVYAVPKNAYVTLTVFNVLGQKVATLVDEKRQAGNHRVRWDGTEFPSSIYFYRLETQGFSKTMKMLLMK